jgi:hypothetical protein
MPSPSRNELFENTSKFDRDLCMLLTEDDYTESDEFVPAQDEDEETKEHNNSLQDELNDFTADLDHH